jgi:hypothetical protein
MFRSEGGARRSAICPDESELPFGVIVGIVELADICPASECPLIASWRVRSSGYLRTRGRLNWCRIVASWASSTFQMNWWHRPSLERCELQRGASRRRLIDQGGGTTDRRQDARRRVLGDSGAVQHG